jgi:chromosome partitioning protein
MLTAPDSIPSSLRRLVQQQADELTHQLTSHRLASFPPSAAKNFRRLSPSESAGLLGVTESYLRQLAQQQGGQIEPGASRRSYSLEDLNRLRVLLEGRARTPGKYLPHRRPGETLQSIAVVNFKGGSAKTTTAANLAQYLALHGYRVLAIDLDPQASLTALFGVQPELEVKANESIYGAIRYDGQRVPASSVVRKTYMPGLDLVPAALELMEFEHETPRALMKAGRGGGSFFDRVASALGEIEADYDVAVLDCPPQLGYLTLSALVAATSVLITVHPQMLDVMSMAQFLTMLGDLLEVIAQAYGGVDPPYDWMRYLITRFEPSDGPQNHMAAFLRALFTDHVMNHPTLKSTAISDAGLTSQTIYEVERGQFTRATYDRAIESVNAVNSEIEQLIRAAWGRA